MSPKAPSNTNTPLRKFKHELGTLGETGIEKAEKTLNSYPRECFAAMLIALMISAWALVFFPSFPDDGANGNPPLAEEAKHLGSGMAEEFSALFRIGNDAQRMWTLEREVERIISKEKIDEQDSVFLEKAIEELSKFPRINPKTHED